MEKDWRHGDLTGEIIRGFYEVYNILSVFEPNFMQWIGFRS